MSLQKIFNTDLEFITPSSFKTGLVEHHKNVDYEHTTRIIWGKHQKNLQILRNNEIDQHAVRVVFHNILGQPTSDFVLTQHKTKCSSLNFTDEVSKLSLVNVNLLFGDFFRQFNVCYYMELPDLHYLPKAVCFKTNQLQEIADNFITWTKKSKTELIEDVVRRAKGDNSYYCGSMIVKKVYG